MAERRVYVAGTCDTKGRELAYVTELVRAAGIPAVLVDVSTREGRRAADIDAKQVAMHHPDGSGAVFTDDRGRSISCMAVAFERFMASRDDVAGLIGLGGSGGTALVCTAMRALPIGIPKLMVSTVASANVAPYVGPSDIAMLYSVTDIAGLNRISRVILANAAHAIAGMARGMVERAAPPADDRPSVGLTMFGVTTPCVDRVVQALSDGFDCLVFHATGTGGRSMEKLVDSGLVAGVIDVTTTEVCDLLMGGVFPCGPDRFDAIAGGEIPYVVSCGALDMVNFGAMDTLPAQYRERNLYVHNPQVTLMRTTPEENDRIGRWIGDKLNRCDGPVRLLIPEGGVSLLDAPGMAFHDPIADAALFRALEQTVRQTVRRRILRLPYNVNDPPFADALVEQFRDAMGEA
jgi:uncharacterized protein (UPF0261 family)